MGRAYDPDSDPLKTPIRCFIGYFCLIACFACVILTVHASMESKRLGYESAQLISRKMELLDKLHQVENRISQLERYKRISKLLEDHLPHLGPPQHPAIAIEVPGLVDHSGLPDSVHFPPDTHNWIDQARKQWEQVKVRLRNWITELVE